MQPIEGADEKGGDVGQRLLGPREEPVNGGAVCGRAKERTDTTGAEGRAERGWNVSKEAEGGDDG